MLSSVWGYVKRIALVGDDESEDENSEEEVTEDGAEIFDDKDQETITKQGTITAVDLDMWEGVIDREYKVSLKKFTDDPGKFKRGSKVEFEAVRSAMTPWTVTSLKLHESDLEKINKERCRFKNVVCQVKYVTTEFIRVEAGKSKINDHNKMIELPLTPELDVGFKWKQGDWVEVRLEYLETPEDSYDNLETIEKVKPVSIAPLQRKTVIGKVTRHDTAWLVNESSPTNSVILTKDVCYGKYVCNDGASVKCEVISSDPPKHSRTYYKWRAINVEAFGRHNGNMENDYIADCEWQDNEGPDVADYHMELLENKCGIIISPRSLNFGSLLIGTSATRDFSIQNKSMQTYVLQKYGFNQDKSVCKFEITISPSSSGKDSNGSLTFLPNEMVEFKVTCTPLMIGKTMEMGIFDFGGFVIGRNFTVIGRVPEQGILEARSVARPIYTNQRGEDDTARLVHFKELKTIRGSQTVRAPFFCQKRLDPYPVPKELYQIVDEVDEEELQARFPAALNSLALENYKQKFQLTLWCEEIENERLRQRYDLHGIKLEKACSIPIQFRFKAPLIQEMYPPPNTQDTVYAFNPDDSTTRKFEGTIVKIFDDEITCQFGDAFDSRYNGSPLTIKFKLGRTTYRRCHYAVETAVDFLGESVLFPSETIEIKPPRMTVFENDETVCKNEEHMQNHNGHSNGIDGSTKPNESSTSIFRKHVPNGMMNKNSSPSTSGTSSSFAEVAGRRAQSLRSRFVSNTASAPSCSSVNLKWFNESLNQEQKHAVKRILRGQARPIPYIIYGPPGTGKTVTLVEAVMQVNKLDTNSRILVCGPSNAAADIVAQYLAESNQYNPGDFVRLNGFLRSSLIPESIVPFCHDGEDLATIAMHRLIISTCMTAGQFFSLDLSIGHFTHVFIDEAGYCTEPETMVPANLLALSKGGQLILAGDPNQLGPVLMSGTAQNLGLSRSFLERLMKRKLYSRDEDRFPDEKYNPLVLTKLVKNYRAHPILLKVPSELFYDNDLESKAPYEEAFALCHDPDIKDLLVTEGVPFIFHGVRGTSTKENSTSWCNSSEAYQVLEYVTALLGKFGLSKDDIGIITPYRKQVELIRAILQLNLGRNEDQIPKVASVEEFQGGERKVMIISTVRSETQDRINDNIGNYEFVFHPKRFNVAITRAKALMIIVGNPFILSRNTYWNRLLQYAVDIKAYKGCNIPPHLDKKIRELVERGKNGRNQVELQTEINAGEVDPEPELFDNLEESIIDF